MKKIEGRGSNLYWGVSLAAITASMLFVNTDALAQQAADASDEEIVVTGIRASLRNSMDVKRSAVNVVDAISAEDIGDFPDKNVSEALQRVTGVQIFRQDGEGRGISIRGVDPSLTRIEVNGSTALALSVAGGDRTVDFRDIPVEFIQRLEVVKSPTADMTEGGLGGTVRLITRRPFDSAEGYLAGSVQGVYNDLADTWDPKLAVIGSRLFFNDTLGVLLSAQAEDRHLYSHNARTTGWFTRNSTTPGLDTDDDFPAGDGINDFAPDIPRPIIDRRDTERRAFNSIVEWRPNDAFKAYFDTTYALGEEVVYSQLLQLAGTSGLIDYAASTHTSDNAYDHYEIFSPVPFDGRAAQHVDLTYRNILGGLTREQYTTTFGGEWKQGNFTFDGRIDYSFADIDNQEINSTATVLGVPRAVVDYTGSEGAPEFSFPGLDVTTGQGVNRLDAVYNPFDTESTERGARLNVRYDFDSGFLTSISAGLQAREYEIDVLRYSRTTRLQCDTSAAAGTGNSGGVLVYDLPCGTIEAIINDNSGNGDEFFSVGELGYSDGVHFWNDNGLETYFATLTAAGVENDVFAVNPNPNTAQTAGGIGSYQDFQNTWKVGEATDAIYLQAAFAAPDFFVPFSGNVGVRYVKTDTTSSGFDRQAAGAVVNFVPRSEEGGYEKVLPSFNLRFEFMPDTLIGRFTASEVLARSPPTNLALRRSLDIVGLTGSRGNPDLQPFQATQYDVGLEWYFTDDSFLTGGFYRKEISNFIINGPRVPEVVDGVTYQISSPINPDLEVTIDGFELGFQYDFGFMPAPFNGLGVTANYTKQESEGFFSVNALTPITPDAPQGGAYPFPGLSESSYNASVYYEDERVSARLTYNWRDEWLVTGTGRGSLPEYTEAYGSLDASASFNLTPHFTLFAEGVNLLQEQKREFNTPFLAIGNETFGSRYFFGIRAKL